MDGQMNSRGGLPRWGRLALPLAVLAVLVALVSWLVSWGDSTQVAAHEPHPGLNFAIEVAGVSGCTTKGGNAKCNLPVGSTFTLNVRLNSIPGDLPTSNGGYEGFDARVTYTGLTSKDNVNITWPACVFGAPSYGPGSVLFGCVIGIGASPSLYTGVIGTNGFNCTAQGSQGNTIVLVHGYASGDTALSAGGDGHAEAGTETLTINCVAPPTNTPSPTPSPTPTRTVSPTPTRSPTPTMSPTPTLTPTPTPLPSEAPDVTITKTDSPDPVESSGTITYTLLVRNLGVLAATGVEIVDTLPPETTFVSASPGCSHDSGVVTCDVGDLDPNDSNPGGDDEATVQIQVSAPAPEADTRVTNLAAVSAENEAFAFRGNNKDVEETVVLAPRPDLTLEKGDAPDPVSSGGAITYTLTARNPGPREAENVVIEDTLPGGVTFVSASAQCGAPVGGVVTCNVGNLPPQGQTSVQIQVTAPVVTQDLLITNSAFVSADNELFSETGNNLDIENTAVIAPAPDLSVSKSDSQDPVLRTRYYSYTLTVSNLGGGDAKDVVVSDVLPKTSINNVPQPVTFVNSKGADCSQLGDNLVQCVIPLVEANGGEEVITINVRAPTVLTDTILTNEVTVVDSDEPDDPPGNNSDSEPTQIRACYDVTGDGRVRIADVLLILDFYGVRSTEPGYDLLFDLDGSGRVTIIDVVLVVNHYGQNC